MHRNSETNAAAHLIRELVERHRREYGAPPEVIASAPGQLTLLGEHADYNDGLVLSLAMDFRTYVGVTLRDDQQLRFCSVVANDRKRTNLANLRFRREDRWANYPKGIIDVMVKRGLPVEGLGMTVNSDVPESAGLAASAALGSATTTAIAQLFGWPLSGLELAQIARTAENEFVGAHGGVAEQLAAAYAQEGSAIMVDARSLEHRHVALDLSDHSLLVTNSSVPQALAETELRQRRADCEECVDGLRARKPGRALRDYVAEDLRDSVDNVSETQRRRCRHIVEEIQRVRESLTLLARSDLAGFGRLLNRSHESLRDLFEVSCPELDWLVKRAWESERVLGARMTGAGFGGCTITLLERGVVEQYQERVAPYERIFGFKPEFYLAQPRQGVRLESLPG